jgi:hypothetical protein
MTKNVLFLNKIDKIRKKNLFKRRTNFEIMTVTRTLVTAFWGPQFGDRILGIAILAPNFGDRNLGTEFWGF